MVDDAAMLSADRGTVIAGPCQPTLATTAACRIDVFRVRRHLDPGTSKHAGSSGQRKGARRWVESQSLPIPAPEPTCSDSRPLSPLTFSETDLATD